LKQEQSDVSFKSKEEIAQLKAQLGKQEKEYNERVQAYIINLNGMKEKVKAAMTEKDKQIAQLRKKLKNKLKKWNYYPNLTKDNKMQKMIFIKLILNKC
jgi:hypothetical protein